MNQELFSTAEAWLNADRPSLAAPIVIELLKGTEELTDELDGLAVKAFVYLTEDAHCDWEVLKELTEQLLEARVELLGANDELVSDSYLNLSYVHTLRQQWDEAEANVHKALSIRLAVSLPIDVAEIRLELAKVYFMQNKFAESQEQAEMVPALCADINPQEDTFSKEARDILAMIRSELLKREYKKPQRTSAEKSAKTKEALRRVFR